MSALCAICTREIDGPVHREPLGRDGALVTLCFACSAEHPRTGRYSFAEGPARGGVGDHRSEIKRLARRSGR